MGTEWLNYQSLHLQTGAIDWKKTREAFKAQKMDGKVLPKLNELSLRFLGIVDEDIIDHLVSSIGSLLREHGAKKKIKESKSVDVPSAFLCPISNEVMKDPVIAFDGYTYERSEIQDYLKQHNKSPQT